MLDEGIRKRIDCSKLACFEVTLQEFRLTIDYAIGIFAQQLCQGIDVVGQIEIKGMLIGFQRLPDLVAERLIVVG